MDLTEKDIARFWSKVDKRGEGECWEWKASCQVNGYGQFALKRGKVILQRSHRVAYIITYGNIPDGLIVCHHCDNKKCCNPNHLFAGSYSDNNWDTVLKGRARRARVDGEHNPRHKVTWKQVNEIRLTYKTGSISMPDIGKRYGVKASLIFDIVHHRTWL